MNGYGRREGDGLRRLALMLIALAALADLACGRSRKVRRNVLDILRRSECLAWDYVALQSHDRGLFVFDLSSPQEGDSVEHAVMVAHSFRMLAMALFALAALPIIGAAKAGFAISGRGQEQLACVFAGVLAVLAAKAARCPKRPVAIDTS